MQTRELIDQLARTPLSQILVLAVVLSVVRLALHPYLVKTKPHMRFGSYKTARFINEFFDSIIYAAVFIFMIIRPFAFQTFVIPSGSMWSTLLVNDYIGLNKYVYRSSDPKAGDVVVFRPPTRAVTPNQIDNDGQVKIDFIKRCIGTPGDLVEFKNGILYRNGRRVDEAYTHLSKTENQVQFFELNDSEKASWPQFNWKLVQRDGKVIPLCYTEFDANARIPRSDVIGPAPYVIADEYALSDPAEMNALKEAPAVKIPAGYYLMVGDNRNNSNDGRFWGLVPRESVVGKAEFIWWPASRWGRIK